MTWALTRSDQMTRCDYVAVSAKDRSDFLGLEEPWFVAWQWEL